MRNDLRKICRDQIARIKDISDKRSLEKEEIESLKGLATALKTLEDSKTPEADEIAETLRVASMDDIYRILAETEDAYD